MNLLVPQEKSGFWVSGKLAIPGLNREIIAKALLQVARLNHLKSGHFDPDALWNRVHGDVNLLRELADLFAVEVPEMLAGVEKAIKHGSPSDLEKSSHKVKGSMLQFSAHAAADIALELEEHGRVGSMANTAKLYCRNCSRKSLACSKCYMQWCGIEASHKVLPHEDSKNKSSGVDVKRCQRW